MPTIFDAAKKPIDPDWKLDGRSILPVLKDPHAKMPNRTLYWRRKGVDGPIALRDQDWKIVIQRGPNGSKPALYNLATDLGEAHNIASEHPEVVTRLMAKLNAWESELTTPLWGPGSPGFVEKLKKRKE